MDRALNGVEEPVYHRGELVGTRRVYNDRLLMFLLRNRAADRFGVGVESGVRQGRGSDAVPAKELARLNANGAPNAARNGRPNAPPPRAATTAKARTR